MRNSQPKKEKVTVSVDSSLLQAVDAFVKENQEPGLSRSAIVEHALYQWVQERRDAFDRWYYSTYAEQFRDDGWNKITTEAAKYIWDDQQQ